MLSRSSLEVRAPSRVVVVSENGEGKGGGASEAAAAAADGGSLGRLWWWTEDVAEAEAEWEGEGDCELRERTGAVRRVVWPSIVVGGGGERKRNRLGF